MKLYSTKMYSHPTVYVYSKRLTWSWVTPTYRSILMPAYPVLRTPTQATAPSGRTHSSNLQCVRGFFEFENYLRYISARYHAIRLRSVPGEGQRLSVGGDEACAFENKVTRFRGGRHQRARDEAIGTYGFVGYHRKTRNDVLFVVPIDVLDSRE